MPRAFLSLFFLINSLAFSQDVTWYEGSIVLADQQVIPGELSVQTADLILFRDSQGSVVYPAHKIQSLRYYDHAADINRKYVTLTDPESTFHQRRFYEVVVVGKLDIVRKQKANVTTSSLTDALDFDYFVKSENNLISLQQFRKKLYPRLIADSELLHQFVRSEKLDASSRADAIRIVMYYNRIITAPSLASLQ